MVSRNVIFWDVDTQADFMLPGGKLYVPGAENLLPNLNLLTDAARRNEVFLVSDACVHGPDDEEFKRFPPHCVRGTPGAAIVPETVAGKRLRDPQSRGRQDSRRPLEGAAGDSGKADARRLRQSATRKR